MASSGQMKGNTLGDGDYFFINWSLDRQEISNNRSLVDWGAYWHFDNSDRQLDNGDVEVNGATEWNNGGRVYNYSGNISTRNLKVASGSIWINHTSNGSKTFNINGGLTGYVGERSSGSKNFTLPTIPRNANLVSPKPSSMNSTTALQHGIDNPANGYIKILIRWDTSTDNSHVWAIRYAGRKDGTLSWNLTEAERDELLSHHPNEKTFSVRLAMWTYSDSGYDDLIGDGVGYTFTYNVTDLEPTFADFTHKDKNSATVAITGNDQYYIQGHSVLETTVSVANKATALKYATMDKYRSLFSSLASDATYSSGSDVVDEVGVVNVNANAPLTVRAFDSRGLYTDVVKTLDVLPYVAPVVNATAVRTNNFEAETTLNLSAVISRLTISGTDKNAVNTSTGVAYRYKETSSGTWGSWVNKTSSTTAENVTVTPFTLTLDNTKSYDFEVRVIDKLSTSTISFVVPKGTPIMFVDQEGVVAINGTPSDYSSDARETAEPTKLDVKGAIRQNGVRVMNDAIKKLTYSNISAFSLATSTWKRMIYTTKINDSLGGYSTSTGIFTVPKTGVYSISASYRSEPVSGQYRYVFGIGTVSDAAGNTRRWRDEVCGGGNIGVTFVGHSDVYLVAGDQIGIYFWHDIGSTRSMPAQSSFMYSGLNIVYKGDVAPELP